MLSTVLLVSCIFLACIVAAVGLFRPFLGLLVFLMIHFIQPGEMVPALAPLRIELVYAALLIGLLIFRRRSVKERSPFFTDHVLFGAVALTGAAALSVPFALWRGGAIETVFELMKLVVLMALIRLIVDTENRLRGLLWCMTTIGAWFAASSLSAFYRGEYYHLNYNLGNLNRAQGVNSIVGGPNELAGALLALLPLLIALLSNTRSWLARLLLIICGAVSLVAIALTGSRIAIVGLLAIAVFYTFQSKHRIRTVLAIIFIGCSLWIWMPPQYRQRYLTVEEYAAGAKLDDSNELRLKVWTAGREIFLQRPILGVGAGQFPIGYGLIFLRGRHAGWMQPHNLLIQVACELGMVGLLAFGYFLMQIVKAIVFVLREKSESSVRMNYQVGLACAVMLVGVLILSAVSHTLYRPYWYLLGGMVAANQSILRTKLKAISGQPNETVGPESSGTFEHWNTAPQASGEIPLFIAQHEPRRLR
jgi:O-antigen ligase